MYYEEQVIDGVLCWRNIPKGEWTQFDVKELTQRLLECEEQAYRMKNENL